MAIINITNKIIYLNINIKIFKLLKNRKLKQKIKIKNLYTKNI